MSREAGKVDGESRKSSLHTCKCVKTLQPNTHIPAFGCYTQKEVGEGGALVHIFIDFYSTLPVCYSGKVLFSMCVKDVECAFCW